MPKKRFYTQQVLTHRRFYTQQAFTQRSFYTQQAFTHSKHETQQAFTHSKLTASFYTHSKHLHTASFHSQQAFTQRSFYKQKLSHTGSLYAVKPKAHTRYLLRHSLRPMNKEASGYGRRACRRQLNRMLVCKRKKDTYMQV